MKFDQHKPPTAIHEMAVNDSVLSPLENVCSVERMLPGRLFITGFDLQEENEIISAVSGAYVKSRTLRRLIDAQVVKSDFVLTVRYVLGACSASQGVVEFDPALPSGARSVSGKRAAWGQDQVAALLHASTFALSSMWDSDDPPSTLQARAALSDVVLGELGVPPQFALIELNALAVDDLTYKRRWQGSPVSIHWMYASQRSNVVHLRRAPASLPLHGGSNAGRMECSPQAASACAAPPVSIDLTWDVLAQPLLDEERFRSSVDSWRWDGLHPHWRNFQS